MATIAFIGLGVGDLDHGARVIGVERMSGRLTA